MFTIREISLEDAKVIHELIVQLDYDLPFLETTANINAVIQHPDNCAFVALYEDTVVGWIHAFRALRIESKQFIEIGGLVVEKEFRGKGVGKLLVNRVKEWCCELNIPTLRLRSNVIRHGAHQFYHQLGFKESKQQKVFDITVDI